MRSRKVLRAAATALRWPSSRACPHPSFAVRAPCSRNSRTAEAAIDSPQADLFGDGLFFEGQTSSAAVLEAPAEPDPALREFAEAVAGLDVDSLTPREALAKLYEIREEAVKAAKGI